MIKKNILLALLLSVTFLFLMALLSYANTHSFYTDAGDFRLSPNSSGMKNKKALQEAVDKGGTIVISKPGVYNIGGTVYIGSNTAITFGNHGYLKKVNYNN